MEEIQPATFFAMDTTWPTLQGQSPPPTNVALVQSELMLMAPGRIPRFGTFGYLTTQAATITKNFLVCGSFFGMSLQQTQLLVEIPSWNVTNTDVGFSSTVLSGKLEANASGVNNGSSVCAGQAVDGIAPDFSGDVYSKVLGLNTSRQNEVLTNNTLYQFECHLDEGAKYSSIPVMLSPSYWAQDAMQPTTVFVILRPEHNGKLTIFPPLSYSQTCVYLPLQANSVTVPAYSNVYVDTGDSAFQVFHVKMSLTSSELNFTVEPNYVRDGVPQSYDISGSTTWLCTVIFAPTNSTPLGIVPWQPQLRFVTAYANRVIGFTALKAGQNVITAYAKVKAVVPPSTANTLYAGCEYPDIQNPVEQYTRLNRKRPRVGIVGAPDRLTGGSMLLPLEIGHEPISPKTTIRK